MPSILIVDDDHALIGMVADHLKSQGHEVSVAMDGLTVARKIEQTGPDLLILDFQMPAASGAKVLERLRGSTHTRTLPVIVLTGKPLAEVRKEIPDSPLLRFLQKPVDLGDLQNAIAELLGGGS